MAISGSSFEKSNDGQESPMLHTFRENWPAYSGEEDFFKVFTIYGHGAHLDQHHIKKFHYMYLKAYIQNLVQNGPVVSEKSVF